MAILGSERQGGEAVEICLIWVGLCLEQNTMSDLLVAILNSVHQGGPNGVVLGAHDGARLEQVESNRLDVAIYVISNFGHSESIKAVRGSVDGVQWHWQLRSRAAFVRARPGEQGVSDCFYYNLHFRLL